ncbi:hypothetical protein [Phocaeicola sp.]
MGKEEKYEFTGQTIIWNNITLHRIRAIRDFGTVNAGTLGGWIESEDNLSHNGNAWVSDNAKVFNSARVAENAKVMDNATVYDNAKILDNAHIYGNAGIYGGAGIYGSAVIRDNALVGGSAHIGGNADIGNHAIINSYLDYCVLDSFGHYRQRSVQAYKVFGDNVLVYFDGFRFSVDEFEGYAKRIISKRDAEELLAIAQIIRIKFGLRKKLIRRILGI